MAEKTKHEEEITPGKPQNVACCTCLSEIPESVATNSEADEYIQHFCGIECYTQWHDEAK